MDKESVISYFRNVISLLLFHIKKFKELTNKAIQQRLKEIREGEENNRNLYEQHNNSIPLSFSNMVISIYIFKDYDYNYSVLLIANVLQSMLSITPIPTYTYLPRNRAKLLPVCILEQCLCTV